jgi:hypothetical protein
MLTDAEVDDNFSALLSGNYWSIPTDISTLSRSAFVTYSFSTSANSSAVNDGYGGSFSVVREEEKVIIRQALDQWASIGGVKFLEVQQHNGDIEFGYYDFNQISEISENTIAFANYPVSGAYYSSNEQRILNYSNSPSSANISIDTSYRAELDYDSSLTYTALHEIGHTLGFKHPFEGTVKLPTYLDNGINTVLSYSEPTPNILGQLDIKAAQYVYGSFENFASHLTSWNWNSTTETLTQVGTAATEFLRGTQANDIISTGGGEDTLSLGGGNDKVIADASVLNVNGGEGFDTVITTALYLGDSKDYGGVEFYTVYIDEELKTKQVYQNVERIEFNNGTLAFDGNGNAGIAYRMYQAAFDRVPDTAGLGYWIRELDNNQVNISSLAANFIVSNEFLRTYGNQQSIKNLDFVELLYQNVLNRTPDSAGQSYWLNQLNNDEITRHNTLASFSDSAENITNIENEISGGIWFI